MPEPTIAQRIDHRVNDEVHDCIRPGCTGRARVAFYVSSPLRLGGRDFMPDEFVDLCPDDADELRRAEAEALALGFGGPFDTPQMRMVLAETNPLDPLKEWLPGETPALACNRCGHSQFADVTGLMDRDRRLTCTTCGHERRQPRNPAEAE